MIRSFLLAGAAMFLSVAANAQMAAMPATAPTPLPPSANDIPLALAQEAAQGAIAACKANGYNVTATVMDKDYGIRVVLRSDGARTGPVDIGRRKAYTVIKTGMSSGEHAKAVGPVPRQPDGGLPIDPSGDPNMVLLQGGIQVKKDGQVVGALAVSGAPGGDKDEACATAGLAKIADRLK